jgi:hypothetical protein
MKEDTLYMTHFYYLLKHYLADLEKYWFEILTIQIFILITFVLNTYIFITPQF